HVAAAAAEEIAVLLAENEGIEGPVGALGLDYVHVTENEHRLLGRMRRAPPNDQRSRLVPGKRLVRHEVNVGVRNAGRAELVGEKRRYSMRLAAIMDAWDLDRLLEDLTSLRLPGGLELRGYGARVRGRNSDGGTESKNQPGETAHISCPLHLRRNRTA